MHKFWKSMLAGMMLAVLLGMPGLVKCSYAETDVTDKVELVKSRMMFNRSTSQNYLDVSVKNISGDVLLTPIKVVIDSISSTDVTVANADGTTGDGKPYFVYEANTGQFLAGEATESKTWYFDNPNRARFSFTTIIFSSSGVETINGIIVPPVPDEATNNETIAGIDSNSNGLRDDVERILAEEFGTDPVLYEEIKQHALTLQEALTNPTQEPIDNHLDSFRCIRDNEKLDKFIKSTTATINTPLRSNAYSGAFAGVTISDEGCPE